MSWLSLSSPLSDFESLLKNMCFFVLDFCICCKEITGVDETNKFSFVFCNDLECDYRRCHLQEGDLCEDCAWEKHDPEVNPCSTEEMPTRVDVGFKVDGRSEWQIGN